MKHKETSTDGDVDGSYIFQELGKHREVVGEGHFVESELKKPKEPQKEPVEEPLEQMELEDKSKGVRMIIYGLVLAIIILLILLIQSNIK